MTSSLRRLLFATCMTLSAATAACATMPDQPEDAFSDAFSHISVPENRANPDSREIEVAYLRLEGTDVGVPTFVFFGGPGESATDFGSIDALRSAYGHLLAHGDVVFIEQRGVGASQPNLDCAPIRFPLDRPVTPADMADAHARLLPACVATAGADMRGYTTAAIADDADAIREAMGYGQINLSGGSYGAQQAFYYIRRHGEHVNRAVLTQFLLPGTSLAMPSTIDSYIAELGERLGPAFGQPQGGGEVLSGLIGGVLERLEEEPVTVPLGETTLTVGRTDLEITTALALRRTRESWLLPMLYSQMDAGEFSFVGQAMMQFYRERLPVNAAVIAFDCADQTDPARLVRFEAEASVALTGAGAHLPFPAACDALDHGGAHEVFLSASDLRDVPTLFIQGELDARAHDEDLVPILAEQENARLLVIGNATHDLGRSVSETIGSDIDAIEAAFLSGGLWPEADRIDVPLSLD